MTPDELDTAVRDELRAQARLTPASAPVKAQVLLATRSLSMEEKRVGGLRAWVAPMLAAAAVLLVTLGVTAGPRLLRSDGPDRTPPAVSSTSALPTPSASVPSPTATSKPASATQTTSAAASNSAGPGVPQDWYQGLDVDTLPHTPGLCPQALTVGTTDELAARAVSVPGEPAPLWLLPVTCNGMTNASHPLPIEVFRYSPAGPRLVQTLAYEPGDRRSIMVTSINGEGQNLVLAEKGYSPNDALCCRSLRFSQDYTWSTARSRFVAGPQVDTLLQCTGDQLTVTSTPLTSQSGDARGILLTYVNDGKEPCTLTGYPGAAIVDAAGQPLADAARTPAGALGGYTSAGSAPRVVLYSRPGSAVIEWVAAQRGGSRCHSQATLLSTPPGTTATRSYGAQPLVCGLQVHPVVLDGDGKG